MSQEVGHNEGQRCAGEEGSWSSSSAAVGRNARKAGIGYREIVAGHTTPSELRALVEKLVPAG
ncbi:hypothetical protein [Qipengyuania gelatinilytica]|uniref:Uncharacterized protein n=1 Tax=Qipengyuania gelatinilytica TaxID=2867231 RepID=A0ABX9ABN6_9SPHN|nr:hypothetical protein [Qipengyuania gelatinilytica]QZD96633.1 hypothetical protein K3136_10385 [Qipengyuania gelatinilytica]